MMPITTANENLSADFLALADAYLALFDGITEDDARLWTEGVDQTPAENLASMIGWWQRAVDVMRTETTDTAASATLTKSLSQPLPGFAWEEKKAVELSFEDDFADLSIEESRTRLRELAKPLARLLAAKSDSVVIADTDNDPRRPLSPWFLAFAAHRRELGLTDAPADAAPLALFFFHFTRSKMRELLNWKNFVGHVTREPPHALWWF